MPDTPAAPPWWQYARKAVVTGASLGLVALSSLVISLTAGSDEGTHVSTTEWVRLGIAVLTAIVGTGAAYKVPNNYGQPALRAVGGAPGPEGDDHLGRHEA
jgi:hypothetical protein